MQKKTIVTNTNLEKTDDLTLIKNTLIELLNKINKIENDRKRINE